MSILMSWLEQITAGGLLEILVLAMLFYFIIEFFRGTRGAQVLWGFITLLLVLMVLTRFFHLDALNWLLQHITVYFVLAVLIIFQPEIRRALAEIGKQHVFAPTKDSQDILFSLVQAVLMLSQRKIGALIAIEREIGLRSIQESGVRIDSVISPELLSGIFFPQTPLHDGGVVIQGDRITAAGCLFPLSHRDELSKNLGTRHRAAIGLTEETDAIVVVVSEETGVISLAYRGRLIRGLDEERLRRTLSSLMRRAAEAERRWSRVKEQLDLSPEAVAKTEGLKAEGGDDHA